MSLRSIVVVSSLVLLAGCPPNDDSTTQGGVSATADESSSTTTTSSDLPLTTGTGGDPTSTTGDPDTTATTTTSSSTSGPPPVCGDGDLDPGEECDEGEANDNEGACTAQCTAAVCGDGYPQRGEECDLGEINDNQGECTNTCTLARCGDGFIQPGEACDEGVANDADKEGGCHPETCQLVTTCGDGMVQDDEECDPMAKGDLAAACTDQCLIARKVIFASSKVYSGNLGGVTQADMECQDLADDAGVPNAEAFIAWLSAPGLPIASRIDHLPVKYVRIDGAPIAAGWDDLIDGAITSAIRKNELGEDAAEMETLAWTGTTHAGELAVSHCEGWMSGSPLKSGILGSVTATNEEWTHATPTTCAIKAHLYCIET